ncbi:Uncharacterized protein ALO61_03883 [Pseudomonas savastanoi pv. nerii]|uniref:hypothetical protein n=1 Tax=Pseudomonas savastanoi TaxID=29438 RepID=UPI0006E5CBAF|nr:hypothetical protein [Pseudomonas savastanoi]KPY12376.1 Uncharacterized protein ALO61_03883 [Pseudomonas savastanoi pv. nerii]KWS44729.1 hypothetical protein AL058_01440 [Pseudomonas savastanoi pv. nerii]
MNVDYAEDWSLCPSKDQMMKQQVHLVSEENRLLRGKVDRYRMHVTKLSALPAWQEHRSIGWQSGKQLLKKKQPI